MAIFGIGATYDGNDVSQDFISSGTACVGWGVPTAPTLYEIMKCIKNGDIIYIKSAPIGKGLRVKAVGIVTDNKVILVSNQLGEGIKVKWIWEGHENLGVIDDKYNVRNNTLYEEYNLIVQAKILDLLFLKINK